MEIVEEIILYLFFFQYVLNPTFTEDDITQLDRSAKLSRAFDGTTYLPGIIFISICLKDIFFFIINILKDITFVHKWLFGAVIEKCRRKRIFFLGCYNQLQKMLRHSKEKLTFFNEYSRVQTSFITLPKGFSELIYNKLIKKKRKIKLAYNIILQVNTCLRLNIFSTTQQYPKLS